MTKSIAKKSTTGSLPPVVPLEITPTFSPWTHTSDDSYIYQLSLVLATATVSFYVYSRVRHESVELRHRYRPFRPVLERGAVSPAKTEQVPQTQVTAVQTTPLPFRHGRVVIARPR